MSIARIQINTAHQSRWRTLKLHNCCPRTPQEQLMVKREIESTDGKIDRLVYELYGLTEDEIKIVES